MSENVVELRDVSKVYRGEGTEVIALSGLNLQVERGRFVSIMGPSGCGKTTLLNLLGALDKPSTGEVILDGVDISKAREGDLPKIRAEKVGFVFQSFNLLPTLTALENVELPMERGRVPKKERRKRALELLKSVGLAKKAESKPTKLSAGEQQRVAIARALANNPAIILADEPTGNLDSKTGLKIVKLLRRLSIQGRTILMVTHDRQMASLGDTMHFLKDGKVLKKEKKGTLAADRKDVSLCPQCNKELSPDFIVCPYCGTGL